MFTGLVEEVGQVVAITPQGSAKEFVVRAPLVASDAALGASISVNGCCLTVTRKSGDDLAFDAGEETLRRTDLGDLQLGSPVNLERALQVGQRLGGHYVTGHVDGLGSIRSRVDDGNWSTIWFNAPLTLTRQMASKGSVTVDGVSLTLVDVADDGFSVALVPHTLAVTILGRKQVGDTVNLETDVLAKYIERQLLSMGRLPGMA
ncbi:MAG: riboflavin synthase [Planctomycetota bacterium]|jgi:riboflavin synthase|nr:riboflavin synthase [Blastopirellula sp.]